jgi:3-oxoacyl-[acyl-carrier-protein] synthase-3
MYINSTGFYIPSARIPNDYFKEVNGLSSEWIYQRTGILTRSKMSPGETGHTMGIRAVEDASKGLPYELKEVNLIVSAGYTPYDVVGTLAHEVQRRFKMRKASALYLSSACSSFINALEVVEGYFALNKADKALVVCSEQNSAYNDESDPVSGHLWGDAAVAWFISKKQISGNEPQIKDIYTKGLGHTGKGPAGVYLKPKEGRVVMPDGKDVFINACKYLTATIRLMAKRDNSELSSITNIVCHQANARIVENVREQLSLSQEVFLNNIQELGNTGAASSPLVLSQHIEKFVRGNKVILSVFGGGYSCGGALISF